MAKTGQKRTLGINYSEVIGITALISLNTVRWIRPTHILAFAHPVTHPSHWRHKGATYDQNSSQPIVTWLHGEHRGEGLERLAEADGP